MGTEQKGSGSVKDNSAGKDIRELREPFVLYRQLRPHLARMLLLMPAENFVDGFYAYPVVNGKQIRVSSYHICAIHHISIATLVHVKMELKDIKKG